MTVGHVILHVRKVLPFGVLLLEGRADMEKPFAQLCTMSFSQCGRPNGPILNRGSSWLTMYVVWASLRSATILICDK